MKDEETPSLPRGQLPSCKRLWRLKVTCVPRTQYHTLQNDVSLEDDPPHIYISRDTKSQKEIMRKGLVKSGSSGNKFWSKSDLGSKWCGYFLPCGCGRHYNAPYPRPRDVHVLIPGNCNMLPYMSKETLKLRIVSWEDYPGLSGWAQCHYERLHKRKLGGSNREGGQSDALWKCNKEPQAKECSDLQKLDKARKAILS